MTHPTQSPLPNIDFSQHCPPSRRLSQGHFPPKVAGSLVAAVEWDLIQGRTSFLGARVTGQGLWIKQYEFLSYPALPFPALATPLLSGNRLFCRLVWSALSFLLRAHGWRIAGTLLHCSSQLLRHVSSCREFPLYWKLEEPVISSEPELE